MYKVVILAAVIAAVSSRPQGHFPKTFRPRPAPHFANAAPAPLDEEIDNLPIIPNIPPRNRPQPQQPQEPRQSLPKDYEIYQNQHAQYEFASDVEDHINDQSQHRQETRDGLAVKGMYSYSDGYYKRTVHYVADENGYRVTQMEAVPLDGPKVDLAGTASVSNRAHGAQLKYKVVSVPLDEPIGKIVESF